MVKSLERSVQFALVEEPSLPVLVELKGLLDQKHWSQNSFFNAQKSLVASHVSLHIPRTTNRHLNFFLLHCRVCRQGLMEQVDAQLRHSVTPLGPPFLSIISLGDIGNELFKQSLDLFL